ncbi:MAG TPA: lipid-A-disaccharide synthase [Puia sp.]|nr:lipid-A-disaccharide synthase [Puia sp.]
MKYYIIAGEASGDLHGSNLITELRKQDPQADIRCWGGDLMAAAGATVVKHYKDLAIMGFAEVLMNLRTIFRNLDFAKKDILAFNPDALIFIDYPGMNMRIAKWARELQRAGTARFRIIYYISPQVWAWKEGRVRQIRSSVDKMLVILPFEKAFYKKWDYEVEYVGHPLVEVIDKVRAQAQAPAAASDIPAALPSQSLPAPPDASPQTHAAQFSKPVIALLPGSRRQEIHKKLPVMLRVSEWFPDYQFVVAQAPGLDETFYQEILSPYPHVAAVRNQTYSLLLTARAACVTSGTATLETALFGVPEVVCYKGSPISYQIARRLIKVKYISLVNLIMDKLVVHELIQDELTPENLRRELDDLLHNPERQEQLAADYRQLHELLSQGGHASANAARSILEFLSRPH